MVPRHANQKYNLKVSRNYKKAFTRGIVGHLLHYSKDSDEGYGEEVASMYAGMDLSENY